LKKCALQVPEKLALIFALPKMQLTPKCRMIFFAPAMGYFQNSVFKAT
jgi:hypothetical protein